MNKPSSPMTLKIRTLTASMDQMKRDLDIIGKAQAGYNDETYRNIQHEYCHCRDEIARVLSDTTVSEDVRRQVYNRANKLINNFRFSVMLKAKVLSKGA